RETQTLRDTLRADAGEARAGAGSVSVRRAGEPDADALVELNDQLARHIGSSPVFFPDSRGNDAAGWREWLADNDHIALLAERDGQTLGYIKAQGPAFDVSYAVHDEHDLGINGMFVTEEARRLRVGAVLLGELAAAAEKLGKTMISVDFESSNREARGFWLRWFEPVTHSFERRL
ncbi:MAG: N-acetyltransferase family protein, partial [Spirochaetota bacterium]